MQGVVWAKSEVIGWWQLCPSQRLFFSLASCWLPPPHAPCLGQGAQGLHLCTSGCRGCFLAASCSPVPSCPRVHDPTGHCSMFAIVPTMGRCGCRVDLANLAVQDRRIRSAGSPARPGRARAHILVLHARRSGMRWPRSTDSD